MTPTPPNRFQFDDPSQDELDALLRRWHDVNAQRAAAGREALMQRLANQLRAKPLSLEGEGRGEGMTAQPSQTPTSHPHPRPLPQGRGNRLFTIHVVSTIIKHRYFRAAASLALLIALAALLMPLSNSPAQAQQIMLPDGGKLEAFDNRGNLIGPCALKHTDVHVDIAGPFSRVTLKQQYHNPYDRKIEAVYTFPLSNRGAVDRMTMTIGDRIIEAEMKERQLARQMYESARQAGHVASLLEQERPNIFTQSVANIEPKAEVLIEISYVEMVQSKDGEYTFDFPMVVAPRYVPGYALNRAPGNWGWNDARPQRLPNELERREGVILRAPAAFERLKVEMNGQINTPNFSFNITPDPGGGPIAHVQRILDAAIPILQPDPAYRARQEIQDLLHSHPGVNFNAIYADGSKEMGQIAADGLGHIAGRWFYFEPGLLERAERDIVQRGAAFNSDTTQVPDGSRISPAPVRPPTRAGHDISLSVSIDTGGPGIIDYQSDLHQIVCTDGPKYRNLGNKINLALKNQSEIPNRDFVLHWRTMADQIQESTFAYMPQQPVDDKGGYFTVIVAPPQRVDDDAVTPRELIFVLDTSGSMSGQPIEKAKAVMARAIDSMRPRDTFNIITFSGDTHILWDKPRPNTPANRVEAQGFLASRAGEGGTEMMNAINAALAPTNLANAIRPLTAEELANLPADGREVETAISGRDLSSLLQDGAAPSVADIRVRDGLSIRARFEKWTLNKDAADFRTSPHIVMRGVWRTEKGERIFDKVGATTFDQLQQGSPLRIVMFLTDGQVGNDQAIIQAVKDNARTTRVFSFGIGDAPNRYLLDGIAQAGRGEVEYVNLQSNPDAAVQRFAKRIGTPVLTDIRLAFAGEGVQVTDTIPPLDAVPDLFDVKPLIIHGRYAKPVEGAAHSQLTIRGTTGAGPYERTIDLNLSPEQNKHSVVATLWARAGVDQLMNRDLAAVQLGNAAPDVKQQIIDLGERYKIMTQYTSFVAVEKARMTIAGVSMLVPVPIELPEGMEWEEGFGRERDANGNLPLVLELKHANPEGLAKELNTLLNEGKSGSGLTRPGEALGAESLNGRADTSRVVAIPGQNAVAIQASPAQLQAMRDLISEFDKTGRGSQESAEHRSFYSAMVGGDNSKPRGGTIEFPWQRGRADNDTDGDGATDRFWNVGLMDNPQLGYIVTTDGAPQLRYSASSVNTTVSGAPGLADPSVLNAGDVSGIVSIYGGATPSDLALVGDLGTFKNAPKLDLSNALNQGSGEATVSGFGGGGDSRRLVDLEPMVWANWPDPLPTGARDPSNDGAWHASVGAAIVATNGRPRSDSVAHKDTDINSDGVADVDKLLAVINHWGPTVEGDDSARYAKTVTLLGEAYAMGFAPGGANIGIIPDKTLTATIVRVERNGGQVLAEIDAGSRDGVKKDWVMTIGRNGDYIAKLRIVNVDTNRAVGAVLQEDPKSGRVVEVGQRAYAFAEEEKEQAESGPTAPIFAEQVAVAIAELVKKSRLDVAHKAADALAQNLPQFQTGIKIRDLLNDQSLSDAERSEKVNALADEAMQKLKAAIAQAKREARLRRVIDQRLWPEVFTDETLGVEYRAATDAAKQPEYKAINKTEGFAARANPITIIILVRDAKDDTVNELKSAGLNVQDIAASTKLVAGDIEPGKLADLALIESVRRIEPVSSE